MDAEIHEPGVREKVAARIQGALAQIHWIQRVYVVIVPPPSRHASAKPCGLQVVAGGAH